MAKSTFFSLSLSFIIKMNNYLISCERLLDMSLRIIAHSKLQRKIKGLNIDAIVAYRSLTMNMIEFIKIVSSFNCF